MRYASVIAFLMLAAACMNTPEAAAQRRRIVGREGPISAARPTPLAAIPSTAAISYHQNGFIFVMNEDGTGATQITFEDPRVWEHVAVSPDRRYIVANEQLPNPSGEAGGNSRLWIFDLQAGTVAQLVPGFRTAGNGGVDWDRNGFIYFAAKDRNVFDNPRTAEEFRANAGANDVYRIRADGSGLQRLLATPAAGEADVGVSEDGLLMAFISQPVTVSPSHTEIWIATSEGLNARLVFVGGEVGIASVHDPELSPDNSRVAFSMVNSLVPPNFPDNPAANTAHDLWQTNLDGTQLRRLTRPGPISIAPDWKNNTILYLDISERDRYAGVSLIDPALTEQSPRRINSGANIAKWIP